MPLTVRDAHAHLFSRTFFETLAGQAPGGRPVELVLDDLATRAGIEIPPADPLALQERWLSAMDEAGVESMVVFASVPEEAETVAEVARLSAGRLTGHTVVNAAAPAAAAFLDRALGELGLRGAVLFPAMHGYSVADPACRPAFERLSAHRAVCVVHAGLLRIKLRDLLGLPRTYDGRFARPLDLVGPAAAFPDLPFILPHFGAGLFEEALLAASWCQNIHLDSSSSNDWMALREPPLSLAEVVGRTIAALGPKRLLFGTDSSTFPRGYRTELLAGMRAALDALAIAPADQALILGGNLERLLAR